MPLEATLRPSATGRSRPYASNKRRIERLTDFSGADSRLGRMILAALAWRQIVNGGPASDAVALASVAVEGGLLTDQLADSGTVCDAISVAIYAERFDPAARDVAVALAEARARGRVADVVLVLTWSAVLAFRRGRIASAEAHAREAFATAELGSFATGTAMFNAAGLSACLIEQGKLDEAQEVLDTAGSQGTVPENVMGIYLLLAQGGLLLAGGNAEAAVSVLREVDNRARGWLDRTFLLPYRSLLALARAQLGEVERPDGSPPRSSSSRARGGRPA